MFKILSMGLLNKELWHEIEEDLGVVGNVEITTCSNKNTPYAVNYTSNGENKVAYISDLKLLVQSLIYACEDASPVKKYKHSSLTHQHSL